MRGEKKGDGRYYMSMVDWMNAETEYVTGKSTYRQLAGKYDVSLTTLAKYAKANKWTDKRKEFRNKTLTETVRKTETLISDNNAAVMTNLSKSARLMSERLLNDLQLENDIKPFNLGHYAGVWKTLFDALPKEQVDADSEIGGIVEMPGRTDGE